jgi:hypothetical protein
LGPGYNSISPGYPQLSSSLDCVSEEMAEHK